MLTVGEILKKQREDQGKSLTEIEKVIRVREKFLKAVENNDWNYFSSKVYISGVIKAYSKILDLDQERMTAFFRREYEKKDRVEFKKKIASKYLSSSTKKLMILGLISIFLLFFTYFGYQLKRYFSPPAVKIISPKQSVFTSLDKIKIKGETEKEAVISIFGERVYQNKEGMFEYDLPLHEGKNDLKIEVIGANGKKAVLTKEYYKK